MLSLHEKQVTDEPDLTSEVAIDVGPVDVNQLGPTRAIELAKAQVREAKVQARAAIGWVDFQIASVDHLAALLELRRVRRQVKAARAMASK